MELFNSSDKEEIHEAGELSGEADPKGVQLVSTWMREIGEALKREKDFRKDGDDIVNIYEGCKKKEYNFNILYSNTDTLLPALYNNTPRPVVQRRFKDSDPVGKQSAKVGQRFLEYYLDSGETGRSEFDELLESAVLDALLPGRGVTAFTFDATVSETNQVSEDSVQGSSVGWNNFTHGYGKTWSKVPWIAYQWLMTREELEDNFGEDIGTKVKLTVEGKEHTMSEDSESGRAPADSDGVKFAEVWQIWDKATKKVITVSPGYPTGPLKDLPDPLNLQGFFNCPAPLRFVAKTSSLIPTPLYKLYEEQATELNRVSARINKIIEALKVRGFYDSTLQGLDTLMEKGDNTLTPAENVAAMLQGQTLEKAIWFFPLEKLINVLQQLYVQRQQTKTVIYEITGISDILRGSTVASETATAQEIKNQWGTLRLKRMQKLVMRYVRSCLRLALEIGVKKLSQETLAQMTGVQLPTNEQKQQAQQQLQMMAQQVQQQMAMAQQSGQQPPPPPPPPEDLVKITQSPTWEEVIALLQNDLERGYKIDIETNSTVDAEATEDKQNMGELINALAQFMNGIGPMITEGVMPFPAAKAMLLAIVRRYRFGTDVEDEINQMQQPKPPEVDPKMQAEMQKAQEKVKQDQEALKAQTADEMMKIKQEQMQLALAKKEFEMEQMFAKRELDMEKKFAQKEIQMQIDAEKAKLAQTEELAKHRVDLQSNRVAEAGKQKERQLQEKESQVAQKDKQVSTALPTLVDSLQTELSTLTEGLTKLEALVKDNAKPKRAKKLPDGTWTTF